MNHTNFSITHAKGCFKSHATFQKGDCTFHVYGAERGCSVVHKEVGGQTTAVVGKEKSDLVKFVKTEAFL